MPVFLIGFNHNTAPVALRERLYFSRETLRRFLARLCTLPEVDEAVVVSTCNRTEIVACAEDPAPIIVSLAREAQIDERALAAHLYVYHNGAAVSHLFRVACGLDSLIVGETQILRQIREALEDARACDAAGRQLTALFQQAVAVGKRARTETAISQGAFSVGRAAVELARALFPDLADSPVLVLGAGKMSEITARHLAANGVRTILVANRTYAHAQELAACLGGRAIHYQELDEALVSVDILISSTSAPHLVLEESDIVRAMERRHGRPLCLIDIAVPRDIDPRAGELPNVRLYNVDDLQEIAGEDHRLRLAEVPKVEAIIAEEVAAWGTRQAGMEVGPVITSLRDAFERVRQAELSRVMNILSDLTPEQRAAVDAMTASMMNKLLHTPTVRLKAAVAAHPERNMQQLLCELFALPDTTAGDEK